MMRAILIHTNFITIVFLIQTYLSITTQARWIGPPGAGPAGWEGESNADELPGVHADRASRHHRDHRSADRAPGAGGAIGARGGAADEVPGQPPAARHRLAELPGRLRRLPVRRGGGQG